MLAEHSRGVCGEDVDLFVKVSLVVPNGREELKAVFSHGQVDVFQLGVQLKTRFGYIDATLVMRGRVGGRVGYNSVS